MTSLVEDEVADLAMKVAASVAKGWGHSDWREYVYGAYMKIRHAVESGVTDTALLLLAGRRGVIDSVRAEKPGGISRHHLLSGMTGHVQFGGGGIPEADSLAAPPKRNDPSGRLLEIWAEAKECRQHLTLRCRVVAYLRFVECWTLRDIGDILNVSESAACHAVNVFTKGVACPTGVVSE